MGAEFDMMAREIEARFEIRSKRSLTPDEWLVVQRAVNRFSELPASYRGREGREVAIRLTIMELDEPLRPAHLAMGVL